MRTGADFMSILSQIGIAILIITIVLILIRSDKKLVEASREGEHFVDEWALREEKKRQLAEAKKQREKQLRMEERERKKKALQNEKAHQDDRFFREERSPEYYEDSDTFYPNQLPTEKKRKAYDLVLIELDQGRKPVGRVSVSKIPFHIGRDAGNDLVIDDLCVARKHCRIVEKKNSLVMEDGGSRNKVLANGNPVDEIILKDGMVLGIGTREYMVEINGKSIFLQNFI